MAKTNSTIKYQNNMYYNTQQNQQRYSVVDVLSTNGRIGRQAYFVSSIIFPLALFWILATIAGVVSKLGVVASTLSYALLTVSALAVLLIVVRLTIQRCHDFNASGWISWFAIIPFANVIFAMIPGNNGLNSYGEAPEPPSTLVKVATKILAAILLAVTAYSAMQLFGINPKDYFG